MSALKSQMFFGLAQKNFLTKQKNVDKRGHLCLNVSNMEKDFDGKFVLSSPCPESRWLVQTGTGARADLIPESDV